VTKRVSHVFLFHRFETSCNRHIHWRGYFAHGSSCRRRRGCGLFTPESKITCSWQGQVASHVRACWRVFLPPLEKPDLKTGPKRSQLQTSILLPSNIAFFTTTTSSKLPRHFLNTTNFTNSCKKPLQEHHHSRHHPQRCHSSKPAPPTPRRGFLTRSLTGEPRHSAAPCPPLCTAL